MATAVTAAILALFCAVADAQTSIRLAAAADLQPVLPPVLAEFTQQTGIAVETTYQASAALTASIQQGAPFDVFMSADTGFPKKLIESGQAEGVEDAKVPTVYAKGTLVLWARKDAHLPPPSLELLRSPELKTLAIANPDRAPYGRAAMAALTTLHLASTLKPKLVTAENISQAAQFVDSGNADAGLISMTSALTPRLPADGTYFVMPRDAYPALEQAAVVVKNSPHAQQARQLLRFVLSAPVQAQLSKAGLTPVR